MLGEGLHSLSAFLVNKLIILPFTVKEAFALFFDDQGAPGDPVNSSSRGEDLQFIVNLDYQPQKER